MGDVTVRLQQSHSLQNGSSRTNKSRDGKLWQNEEKIHSCIVNHKVSDPVIVIRVTRRIPYLGCHTSSISCHFISNSRDP